MSGFAMLDDKELAFLAAMTQSAASSAQMAHSTKDYVWRKSLEAKLRAEIARRAES